MAGPAPRDHASGTFLAFSTYVTQLVAPAQRLAGVLTIGQQARAGVERIFQLLDLRPAITDRPDAIELPGAARRASTSPTSHFAYGDGPPVLRGLRPAHRRRRAGGPGRAERQRQVDRWPCCVSRFYDPQRGRSASTATTCAT